MNILENIYQIAFILLSSVGGAVIIIAAFSSWLGKVWANRILQSEKAKYTQELDKMRHQLRIELDQLSIIHEQQRLSFQRMIRALHDSIKSLEQSYDEEWQPIDDKHCDTLKEIIIEESLFLGAEAEKALNIYLNLYWKAVYFPENPKPDDETVRKVYEFLNFISERIREYFRKRIGLSFEANPLLDVNLIATCLLIYESQFQGIVLKTIPILEIEFDDFQLHFDISPSALVDKLKQNLDSLKSDLSTIISFIETKLEKRNYELMTLSEARYYKELLDNA